jgi:SsrA-binding protein
MRAIATNRKARHDYFILESYEAGIVLQGAEVKSLRERRVNLADSFARAEKGEIFLYNMHISPYVYATQKPLDPTRSRKLLFHRQEIHRLIGKISQRGLTLIPLRLYFKISFLCSGGNAICPSPGSLCSLSGNSLLGPSHPEDSD